MYLCNSFRFLVSLHTKLSTQNFEEYSSSSEYVSFANFSSAHLIEYFLEAKKFKKFNFSANVYLQLSIFIKYRYTVVRKLSDAYTFRLNESERLSKFYVDHFV